MHKASVYLHKPTKLTSSLKWNRLPDTIFFFMLDPLLVQKVTHYWKSDTLLRLSSEVAALIGHLLLIHYYRARLTVVGILCIFNLTAPEFVQGPVVCGTIFLVLNLYCYNGARK